MMALGLITFLVAIGAATMIESVYNIQAAKIIIYNAMWFEVLLVYLGLSLIANIFRYKMYSREKAATLMFHLSFIVILIGAGVTRFISFEGQMRLPEADKETGALRPVDYLYSTDPKLKMVVDGMDVQFPMNSTKFMSEITDNYFQHEFTLPKSNKKIAIEFLKFQPKHIDSLVVNDTIQEYALEIVTGGMSSSYLAKGGFLMVGSVPINFEKKNSLPGIELTRVKNQMMIKTQFPMTYLPMSEMQRARESGEDIPDSMYVKIPVDTLVPFKTTTLYKVEGEQFVFKQLINHAKRMLVPSGRKDTGMDYLTVRISVDGKSKDVVLEGGMGQIPVEEMFKFNNTDFRLQYGAIPIRIPFSLACNEFTLDRYPGSSSPSSFGSVVTVIDPAVEKNHTQRIFMNNVMDYDGYRFFQSGYFPDESGTILSVNHDWWGTNITYIGYLMMAIGMIMSLFAKGGRFRYLNQSLSKIAEKRKKLTTLMVVLFASATLFGQEVDNHEGHNHGPEITHDAHDTINHDDHTSHEGHNHGPDVSHENVDHSDHANQSPIMKANEVPVSFISKEHSEKISYMLVLDFDGRVAPFHTICDELLRKIHRSDKFEDGTGNSYNAVQTILSMHMSPEAWMTKKIVYVSAVLRDTLGVKGKYASIVDLLNDDNTFKLASDYQKAHQKLDKNKGEYDKQLIKLVERYQIIAGFPNWTYLKIIPVRNDSNNSWFSPMAEEVFQQEEELFKVSMKYFRDLFVAIGSTDYTEADKSLNDLIKAQREAAGDHAPSETKVSMEVSYNKMNIFKNAEMSYLLIGFVLLIIFLVRVLSNAGKKEGKGIRIVKKIFTGLMIVIFCYHGAGLGLRWSISGHAPWSNGYEAVVFIAWVTVLAGFIFSRKNAVILAATAILAFCILFVTEMDLLDPQITPLQPVLKSYWLKIHVAVITGSYGFLGLGAILGFLNMFLYIVRTKENGKILSLNISELTYVSEMTITIGLFMLTIGTFLGGIWANESWGRYWGWDPKETWALVSVLVYAVILHLRFIPVLKSKFVFNLVSLWGYSAILFTFFGVNFYLVGLHSYAQGEGLGEFPPFIWVAAGLFTVFSIVSYIRYKSYKKATKNELT